MDKVHLYRWIAGLVFVWLLAFRFILFHYGLAGILVMSTIGAYFWGFILDMIYSKVLRPIWNFIKGGEE